MISTQPLPHSRSLSTARSLPKDVQERNRRVEQYRAVVRPIAFHYAGICREQADDLQQVGLLGLIRAAELYQNGREIPFEAFARHHIRGAILHYLRDCAPTVRLPRRQQELADRVRATRRELAQDLGRTPAERELREALGLTPLQWMRFEQASRFRRIDVLDQDPAIAAAAEAPFEPDQPIDALAAMAQLEPRQGQVVKMVVLGGASLRQVGRELQVSPMTAHRLLRKGLDQLRQELGADAARINHGQFAAPAC